MGHPSKMSRRQRDHITAKELFRTYVKLAEERNPKLAGDRPTTWTVEFSFIQGYLALANAHENLGDAMLKKLHQLRDELVNGNDPASILESLGGMINKMREMYPKTRT